MSILLPGTDVPANSRFAVRSGHSVHLRRRSCRGSPVFVGQQFDRLLVTSGNGWRKPGRRSEPWPYVHSMRRCDRSSRAAGEAVLTWDIQPSGDPMSAPTINFDDGAVYERMMGKWSGLAGRAFIDWLSPLPNLRWVDIGCGNGAFTQLLVEHCAPMTVEGVDPSEGQLAFARVRLATPVAKFRQGDAMALRFADGFFDAAVMALVVFFIPDPARGVAEMARVVRPGALAAAYVWDVVGGGGPSEAIIIQMKGMGFAPPRAPKAEASTPEGLHALWTRAGFADIEARVLRTRRTFDDFEDYWSTTIAAPNLAPMLTTMATADVTQLKSRVREQVSIDASGRVSIEAQANAIIGRRPG